MDDDGVPWASRLCTASMSIRVFPQPVAPRTTVNLSMRGMAIVGMPSTFSRFAMCVPLDDSLLVVFGCRVEQLSEQFLFHFQVSLGKRGESFVEGGLGKEAHVSRHEWNPVA